MVGRIKLNFRDCLLLAFRLFLYEEFDAKQLSTKLQKYLTERGYASQNPELIGQVSTKRISNDLDRLYRMGLLSARRMKRQIVTKKNKKICNKGYQYLYRISKQGSQYLDYLLNPEKAMMKNEKDKSARLVGISLQRIRGYIALGNMPNDMRDVILDLAYKQGGRHRNRFLIKNGPELSLKYLAARNVLRKHGIADNEFYREFYKLIAMANIIWPHLGLEHIKQSGRKTMLDEDGENRHFLDLLNLSHR